MSHHLRSIDFLSVQVDCWDSPWQNRHAFVSELSKTNRVLFLGPPSYLVDVLRQGKPRTRLPGLTRINPNLFSYVPPRALPYNYRFPRLDSVVRNIRHLRIRGMISRLGLRSPVLYVWHPDYSDLIGEFGESLVVYHKYDNYSGYYGGSGKPDPREDDLIRRADLFFVTSRGLMELHRHQREDIHLVPNGVDFERFARSCSPDITAPDDLSAIPRPRIGYVGVVNEKVDFRLLTHICRERPGWSIVLVGPEKVREREFSEDLGRLKQQRNCFFLGQKANDEIPAYIGGLDVCMMCYLVNDWTYYGYPLKMHEYLACGKPTISAALPAVREFEEVVEIPEGLSGWVTEIESALAGSTPQQVEARLRVARENSWAVRCRTALELIARKLERRDSAGA